MHQITYRNGKQALVWRWPQGVPNIECAVYGSMVKAYRNGLLSSYDVASLGAMVQAIQQKGQTNGTLESKHEDHPTNTSQVRHLWGCRCADCQDGPRSSRADFGPDV